MNRQELKINIISVLKVQRGAITVDELAYLCGTISRKLRAQGKRNNIFDEITPELYEKEKLFLCLNYGHTEKGVYLSPEIKDYQESLRQRFRKTLRELTQLQKLQNIGTQENQEKMF